MALKFGCKWFWLQFQGTAWECEVSVRKDGSRVFPGKPWDGLEVSDFMCNFISGATFDLILS